MERENENVRGPHAGLGHFIEWLQHEVKVDNRRLTDAALCSFLETTPRILREIKKGSV